MGRGEWRETDRKKKEKKKLPPRETHREKREEKAKPINQSLTSLPNRPIPPPKIEKGKREARKEKKKREKYIYMTTIK